MLYIQLLNSINSSKTFDLSVDLIECTKPLSDYLQTISDQYHETNDAVALLEELDALHRFYQEQPLPETREQFENRAILYAILSDLRSLLQIKQQFSVSLPKKGRGSSSFYRKQNSKTN